MTSLGELLKQRSCLTNRASDIRLILYKSCKKQEGDDLPFEVDELYEQYEFLQTRITELSAQIQAANIELEFDGKTMMEHIIEKDILRQHGDFLRDIIRESFPSTHTKEIRDVPTVDGKHYYDKYITISDRLNEVELKIQEHNWRDQV